MKVFIFIFMFLFSISTFSYAESGYISIYEDKVLVTDSAYELDIKDKHIEVFTNSGKFMVENNEKLKIFSGDVELKVINNKWYFKPMNSNTWMKMPTN